MNTKEKELFKELCSFNTIQLDTQLLDYATPTVLGQLFFNRMSAIAYEKLNKCKMLYKVNREIRTALRMSFERNIVKNNSYYSCVDAVQKLLKECGCKYAMLKGAFLCKAYPEGLRTSNDIDLLVMPEDVSKIGNLLKANGFIQGHIRNDVFVAATRQEIIESKMTRGETVPYIKKVDLPFMEYLEIDINFSLDYKNSDTEILEEMINNAGDIKIDNCNITTLSMSDFFIHLCLHLYKEAATLPWIRMNRDMSLYKFCDIYYLLSNIDNSVIDEIFARAKKYGVEKICAFAIIYTNSLFTLNSPYSVQLAEEIISDDRDFLDTVIAPAEKKKYKYTENDIFKRFFIENRKDFLEETENHE